MSRAIALSVCLKQGHNLQSVEVDSVFEPTTKTAMRRFKVICTQCGTPLEDVDKRFRARDVAFVKKLLGELHGNDKAPDS